MRDLNYQLQHICRHSRDGSYATQSNRERVFSLMSDCAHGRLGRYFATSTACASCRYIDCPRIAFRSVITSCFSVADFSGRSATHNSGTEEATRLDGHR
jgi:hypothetical protein